MVVLYGNDVISEEVNVRRPPSAPPIIKVLLTEVENRDGILRRYVFDEYFDFGRSKQLNTWSSEVPVRIILHDFHRKFQLEILHRRAGP